MYEFSVNKKDYINYYLFQNTAANKAYKRNLILSTLFIGFVTLGLSFLNGDTTQKKLYPSSNCIGFTSNDYSVFLSQIF